MEHDLPVVLKLSKVKTGSSLYFSAVRYSDLKSDLFYNTKSDAMVNTEQKSFSRFTLFNVTGSKVH